MLDHPKSEDYRNIFENAIEGIFQSSLDGRFLKVNPAMARIYGYNSPQDMLTSVKSIGKQIYVDAKEREVFLNKLRENGYIDRFEGQNYRKDGSIFWTQTNARIVQDVEGNALYIEGFITDITSFKEAELALRASEERYRALVERLPGVVFLDAPDDHDKVYYVSQKIEDILGYTPQEWADKISWLDSIHPEDRERILAENKRTDETGEPFHQEYRFRKKDGDYTWIREVTSLVKNDQGEPLFWQGFLLDISHQKQAESAIKQSEEQFKKIFQANPIASCIATLEEGRFIAANDVYWKLSGFEPGEFIGHTSIELGFVDASERKKLVARLRKEKSLRNERGKLITKSGETRDTLEFFDLIRFDGQDCILSMFYDMTDQVKAQEALQENEEKYRQLFESESDAIFLIDNESGNILEANAAATVLYGYSKDELLGKKNSDLSAEPNETRKVTQKTPINRDQVISIPLRYHKKKNGTIFPVEITGRFFEWRGRPVHIAAIRDITGRKKVEEALKTSEERFRLAFQTSPDSININWLKDGLYVDVNEGFTTVTGYTREEAIGKTSLEINIWENADERANFVDELIKKGFVNNKEAKLRTKDGRILTALVSSRIITLDGALHIISITREIETIKQAEATLQRQLQELTILHNIAVAATSSNSVDELIQRATDTIGDTLHPDSCGVELVSECGDTYQAHPSYRGASSQEIREPLPLSKGVTGKVIASGKPIRLGDVTQEAAYIEATKGICSELCVPIKIQERIIGAFNIESRQIDAYTESDERLMNTVAGTLATAIQQLRLFETSQRHLQEMTILNAVSMACTRAISLDGLVESITQIIGESLYPDNFGVLLLNEEGTALIPHPSYRGISSGKFPASISLDKGISGQVVTSGKPIRIANVRNHKNFIEVTSQVRSELCVPITHGDRILGVVNAESVKINAFTVDDEQLLATIASTLATAIEKLRLLEEEKKRRLEAETLREATNTLTTSLNLETLLDSILEVLARIVQYDSASIALEQDGELCIVAGKGFPPGYDVIGKKLGYSEKWLLLSTTRQPFIVPDVKFEPRFEQWEGSEYIRGWMGVPMVVHDKLIGFINLDSRRPNVFAERDAVAVQTFANSAAVAIENAHLFENEQQSRERAEALREATAALTTSIELETLYETILDSLAKLIPFDSASIEILDQDFIEVVAGHGLKENIICIGERYPYEAARWREMEVLRRPILIANVKNDDRFIKFEGTGYIRGWMGVPMFAQDKLVGFLNLDSSTENFFTEDHAALAQTFGNQAAIAIENARLFEAEQKRRREAEVLRQASAALTSSLELEDVLDTLLNYIAILIPYNSAAVFMREKDHYKVVAGKGFKHPEKVIGQSFPLDDELSSIVRETRQAIISYDIQKDPRFKNWGDPEDIHGWMCFPLIVRDQSIGHLTIDSSEVGAYDEADAELAMAFANQAATALENARLFEAEQRRHRESETLRQAALAITTSLDLESVLETILAVMKQVLPYDSASVLLLGDDDELELTAAQGFPNIEDILDLQFPADDELFVAIKNSCEPVILKNAQQDERFHQWAGTDYVHGWMGVPLILRNEVIGYITLDSHQEGIYDETLAVLAQAFANQAASAIQNARQFQVEQRHFQEAETLRQTAEAITSTLDIQQVLTSILDNLNRVVPFDSAGVFLIENDNVRLTEVKGMPNREDVLDKLFPASNALLQEIQNTRLPLILKDAQNDSRYERWVGNQVRGWMGVPLIARGAIIGYITIDSQRVGAYNEHDANLVTTFAHQAAAAIENARLYERGEQQIRQFTVLRDIDSAISSSFDLRVTLNLLISYAVRELNVDAVAILLYNSDLKSLSLYTSTGFTSKHDIPSSHIRIGEGLAGRVVLQRKLVHIADLHTATDFSLGTYCIDENFKSYFGVPLIGKGQIKGVLEVYTRKESYPDPDWLNFLTTLAGQAAIAIDNVQLFKNLQRSNQELILAYDTTLAGWGRALELRDKETQGHTDRVVELTIALARRMGIDGEELTHIMRGTLLHDIGKMGIPDQILHKPGPLTEEEWAIMRQHPQYAFDLMNPIPYLRPALAIPYSHHERWDGSGYPRGLKGEDIPLAARIFAVVDIWDALLYERVYRDAWPEDKVIEYIKNTAGIELDPKIVEKFLELIDEERTRDQAE